MTPHKTEGRAGQAQGRGQPPRRTRWVAPGLPWGDRPVKPRGPRGEVQGLRRASLGWNEGMWVLRDGAERSLPPELSLWIYLPPPRQGPPGWSHTCFPSRSAWLTVEPRDAG